MTKKTWNQYPQIGSDRKNQVSYFYKSFIINLFWNYFSCPTDKINIYNNKQEKHCMIVLHPINKLMMKSEIIQLAPSPRTSSILQGNKIHIYSLDKSLRQIYITTKYKYQYQWTMTHWIKKHRSSIKNGIIGQWNWKKLYINLKQLFGVNNY